MSDEFDGEEAGPRGPAAVHRTSLSLAFLAMLPLFAAYELAVDAWGGTQRNAAELALGLVLQPFGPAASMVRRALLLLFAAAALWNTRRRGLRVRSGVARIVVEGVLGAVLLGPALVGLFALLGELLPEMSLQWERPSGSPPLARAGLTFGGAAWEEVLFRVGLYSLLYLLTLRFLGALTPAGEDAPSGESATGLRRWVAEGLGLIGSSLAFSLFHVGAVTAFLGSGEEQFEPLLFTWRFLAGILLGCLFRWRGPGVAAWAHGLFNVALLLGAGPDVLL